MQCAFVIFAMYLTRSCGNPITYDGLIASANFCNVSYPQLRESYFNFSIPLTYRKNTPFGGWSRSGWRVCFLLFYIYFVSSGEKYEQYSFVLYEQLYSHR